MTLTLAQARSILDKTLAVAREKKFKPLGVAVVDSRGALRAYADEDGSPIMRSKVASGKAFGAVAFGAGSRRLHQIGVDGGRADRDVRRHVGAGAGRRTHARQERGPRRRGGRIRRYLRQRRARGCRRHRSGGFHRGDRRVIPLHHRGPGAAAVRPAPGPGVRARGSSLAPAGSRCRRTRRRSSAPSAAARSCSPPAAPVGARPPCRGTG
jgi:hypothetical protein